MPTSWHELTPPANAGVMVDPYFEWARSTGYAYDPVPPDDLVPVLIELTPGKTTAAHFANGIDWNPPGASEEWKNWLRIPWVYAQPSAGLGSTRFLTAIVKPRFFAELGTTGSLHGWVKRFQIGLPIIGMNDNQPSPPTVVPVVNQPPLTVVTGIIDDGLAFAHEQFRRSPFGTRIWYFWDQDPRWDGPGAVPPADPPVLFGYGKEIRKRPVPGFPGIDNRITAATHAGLVDEDQVYSATGHLDFRRNHYLQAAHRTAHGTHVMDLACGDDPAEDPRKRPIVAVQLPGGTTRDTSGSTLAVHVLDGMRYILERADRIAGVGPVPYPVVINLSYGLIAGPHDGTSLLEAAIDDLVKARNAALPVPMRVVLPAGNSHLARCHARFRLPATGSTQSLKWRVQPDDATPSFMEIWLPQALPNAVRVKVGTPNGAVSPWINEGYTYVLQPGANVLCQVRYLSAAATGTRAMILVAIAPTVTQAPNLDIAPAGNWHITVESRSNAGPLRINAWIQRDDTPFGAPAAGRQSRFDDPLYRYRDDAGRAIEIDSGPSHIKRAGSMNSIATGGEPIVIGGFRRSDLKVEEGSAGGGVARPAGGGLGATDSPDALAVNEDSVARHGVLAAGSRSGSTVAMNGTSVSAPRITRWIAGEMAAGRSGDRAAVAVRAQTPPMGIPSASPPVVPQVRAGAGRIMLPPVRGTRRSGR